MAKASTIKTRLESTAEGSSFCYYTKKNARTKTEKIVLRKYDPIIRKHVDFKEGKMK